jgi:transmembrane sensor
MTDEHGPDDPRWEAIHRFLDGLSPLPERREVERWMADDLSVQRYIKAHKRVWSMIGRRMGPKPVDGENAWESLQDRIAEHDRQQRFHLPGRGLEHLRIVDGGVSGDALRRPWRTIAGSAAFIMLGAASFLAIRFYRVPAPVSYTAARGARPHEQILPDGSHFVLAPESHVRYAADRAGERVVTLSGEAEFSVVHDPHRPFVVQASGHETRDVGTQFDVSAYPHTPLRVAVKSGSVSVSGPRGITTINSGEIGRADPTTDVVLVAAVNQQYFDWTVGRLAFADTPLRDVAAELGRKYDVNFEIADPSLAAVSVTITVPDGTLDRALEMLRATISKLQYKREGRTVRLFRQ